MGNLSAILFLLFSFLLPLASPQIRQHRPSLWASWLVIAAHHLAAFVNCFISPLSSAWGDLYRFHDIGAGIITDEFQIYGYMLRGFYKVFGVSFWLGEVLSVCVFAMTLWVFVALQQRLGLGRHQAFSVFVYGILPGPLIHCSVTMREVYQCIGLLTACWALVAMRQDGLNPQRLLAFFAGLGLLVLMHQALAFYALLLIFTGLPWALQGRGQFGAIAALILVLLVPVALPKMINLFEGNSAGLQMIEKGKFLEYAAGYREHISKSRSDYGISIETDSLPNFLSSLILVVLMYFLAPLPWQVSSPLDIYAFIEVVWRILLLVGLYRQLPRLTPLQQNAAGVVLLYTLVLESLWAVGTSNWGTAVRHHVPAYALFAALGASYWGGFSLDPEMRRLELRRQRRKGVLA